LLVEAEQPEQVLLVPQVVSALPVVEAEEALKD